MIKTRHIIVGFRSKATGFVYDFCYGVSVGDAIYLFSRENPDGLPFLVSWGKLGSLYLPVLVPVDKPPVKIDKYVATAMFRAVSFGTMQDDSDFIFHRLLPEAIYLKLGGKSSMCPVTRQCFANDCKACWQRALAMEGYPDSLYWEYKEECI